MTSYNQKIDAIAPETLTALDKLFSEALPSVEKHLNEGVIPAQSSEGHWLVPVVDIVPGKPTTPANGDEAFHLNDAGKVTLDYQSVPMSVVVIRYVFDYASALFAAKSKQAFDVVVGPVVKDMIDELRFVKGFNEFGYSYGDYYGTFKGPGSDVVFRDVESGGVELRLYSNTSKLTKATQKKLEQDKFLANAEGPKSV